MKNIYLLTILSLFFSLSCHSDESEKKKGIKKETVSEYRFEEKFSEIVEILYGREEIKYDRNGYKIYSL